MLSAARASSCRLSLGKVIGPRRPLCSTLLPRAADRERKSDGELDCEARPEDATDQIRIGAEVVEARDVAGLEGRALGVGEVVAGEVVVGERFFDDVLPRDPR